MITGVNNPIKVRTGPSPTPRNLLTVEVSTPSGPLPSKEDSRLVPLSPVIADPVRLLAMLPSMSLGC
jgi:hypothetical protein